MSDLVPIGYVARAVDKDPAEPFAAGEVIDGYAPVEPYAYRPRPSSKVWSVHPHEVPLPEGWEDWRVVDRWRCDCSGGGLLVRTLAGTDGNVWALIKPERIPSSLRRDGHMLDDESATPLHCDANGTPCIQVASCKRCSTPWLVLIFEDRVEVIKARGRRGIGVSE